MKLYTIRNKFSGAPERMEIRKNKNDMLENKK